MFLTKEKGARQLFDEAPGDKSVLNEYQTG
jgi:hypothetical protein